MTHSSISPTAEIAARVRDCVESRQPARIVAASTWQGAGAPVQATVTVSVRDHQAIVEYVPGDLTITVSGGTTLREIRDTTQRHGQFLTLDPWGGDDGTIGATLATATPGPRSAAFGTPRDVVLGMEFVSGTGSVVRAGGRVVKNVAGFDLVRLLTGSWGTLGIITEVTLRLRALPDQRETVVVAVDDARVDEVARGLRALPFTPFAAQLVNGALASRMGLPARTALLAELGGNARSVAAQRESLSRIGSALESASDDVWRALRECDRDCEASWRWSQPPASFADTWARATRAMDGSPALVHGDPWRGVARVVVPRGGSVPARNPADFPGSTVLEVMHVAAWEAPRESDRVDRLARDLRARFDPAGVLNPGILGST